MSEQPGAPSHTAAPRWQRFDGTHSMPETAQIVADELGAHAVTGSVAEPADLKLLVDTLIPEVRRRNLAEFFDVFCEPGVFSVEDDKKRRTHGTPPPANDTVHPRSG